MSLEFNQHRINTAVLTQAKKNKSIIFGAQAIKKKLGINARPPKDFDLFTDKPKNAAKTLAMTLDKSFRKDIFFVKKGNFKTTYKTKFKGKDGRANTDDDIGIADFTKTPAPAPKTFIKGGVKFRTLKLELKAKQRIVKDPEFKFRREKDLDDIRRIKQFSSLGRKR